MSRIKEALAITSDEERSKWIKSLTHTEQEEMFEELSKHLVNIKNAIQPIFSDLFLKFQDVFQELEKTDVEMEIKMQFPETPNWIPLEKALSAEQCGDFMYMGRAVYDGKEIELYKHVYTRRYLNIDSQGNFYCFTGSAYSLAGKESSILACLPYEGAG